MAESDVCLDHLVPELPRVPPLMDGVVVRAPGEETTW